MTLTEPRRSRLLIVVGLVLFAFGTWMQIVTDKSRTPWALLFNAAWLVFLLAVVALNLVMALRMLGAASKRPARFVVAGRRFVTPALPVHRLHGADDAGLSEQHDCRHGQRMA